MTALCFGFMIAIKCDKCERPLKVAAEHAGGKVICPFCKDVNTVPTLAASLAAGDDRAKVLGLPARDGPEEAVYEISGAMFRSRPFSAVAMVAALLCSFGLGLYTLLAGQTTLSLIAGGVVLACLGVMVWWKVQASSERLQITNKRVVFTKGLLGKSSIEMLHKTIQDIQITQTLAQRLWRVGTMTISNSGTESDEIRIRSLPDPYHVRRIVDAYRPM